MSASAEKTSTSSDTLPPAGIGSSSDDPTKGDLTINTPSQILLEALQNFVIPLIPTAEGKNKQDISQVHSTGPEAGKLLIALQEFISSMIVQSQVRRPQSTEVDLDDPDVDSISSNDAVVKSPGVVTESKLSDPGPSEAFIPQQTYYQCFMGRLQEAVREHVFSKMPIRVLHFTDTSRDPGAKLRITLLERNDIYDQIIQKIQASYSERMYTDRVPEKHQDNSSRPAIEDVFIREIIKENTKYAILSHTWLRGSDSEVTYGAWQLREFNTQQPGYQKLANFCRSAWKDHGLSFGWMDTVCINKDSSSELDESIRSMYKWYKNSHICISYLAGSIALGDIHRDPWFTRGWTFQELLAPDGMSFYNKDWQKFVPYTNFGDKHNGDIQYQIHKATTITRDELFLSNYLPISRKMQLAAKRNVMREEDIAYSLMGICNVSISIAYGEGAKRAFFRLMTEVLNTSSKVVDIFNCTPTERLSIIPSGPSAYLQCSKDIMWMSHRPPIEPLLLTHVGLRIPILLMPSLREDDPCLSDDPIGDYYAEVYARLELPGLFSNKPHPRSYYLLDKGIGKSSTEYRRTFGILNFGGDTNIINGQDVCLAICFYVNYRTQAEWGKTSQVERIVTEEPIVFRLMKQGTPTSGRGDTSYSIKRSELAKHGMTLTTMYL